MTADANLVNVVRFIGIVLLDNVLRADELRLDLIGGGNYSFNHNSI